MKKSALLFSALLTFSACDSRETQSPKNEPIGRFQLQASPGNMFDQVYILDTVTGCLDRVVGNNVLSVTRPMEVADSQAADAADARIAAASKNETAPSAEDYATVIERGALSALEAAADNGRNSCRSSQAKKAPVLK